MTLSLYQVTVPPFNYSTVSLPSLFTAPSLPIDTVLARLAEATFYLCPYISPAIRQPPKGIHSHRYAAFCYLQHLTNADKQRFLSAYRDYRHSNLVRKNPTSQTNPYWQWMTRFNLNPWDIKKLIIDHNIAHLHTHGGTNQPLMTERVPWWSQQRMGQTVTKLADGRTLYIGGEYEDCYDPDFCIYNDVIVHHPDGRIETYGYPRAVFPPTDFHTATLVGDYIYLIGSIGYVDERRYSHTLVYRLNIYTLKIDEVPTRNSMGWIYKHKAVLKDNRIVVTGGQYMLDVDSPITDNIDTWELNLNTLIWKNITYHDRHWQRFYVARVDGAGLHLWEYHHLLFCLEAKWSDAARRQQQQIIESLGCPPNLDSYQQLFVPPIPHETPSDWDNEKEIIDYNKIIFMDGIKVGYKSDSECVQVIIEGKLTDEMLELMQQNLRHKLSKVENMACEVIVL